MTRGENEPLTPKLLPNSINRGSVSQTRATLEGMAAENLTKLEASLEAAKARYNKARSDLGRRAARLANARRKRDTRWKILVGAVVLARASRDPAAARRLDKMMDEALTEQRDRDLLKEWRASSA